MVDFSRLGASNKQVRILERVFSMNSELYKKHISAENQQFQRIFKISFWGLILIFTFPFLLDILISYDPNNYSDIGILNQNTSSQSMSNQSIIKSMFGVVKFLGFIIVIYSGYIAMCYRLYKSDTRWNNNKYFQKILNKFKYQYTNLEKKKCENDFYKSAVENKVLNISPENSKLDFKDGENFSLEANEIYSTNSSGRYVTIEDHCIISRISFNSKHNFPHTVVKQNSTENITGIMSRFFRSLQVSLLLCGFIYVFFFEKCEREIIGNGCRNDIDLIGFISIEWMFAIVVLGLLFFFLGTL